MSWVKLDDQFADHPKVLAAGPLAAWLYVCGLTYCGRYLTDGWIPDAQVRKLADVDNARDLADRLTEVGLWDRVDDGYRVHDYLDYNPTGEKVKAERQENARRQAEWRERHRDEDGTFRADNAVSNGVTPSTLTTAPSPSPSPSPDPVPVPSESVCTPAPEPEPEKQTAKRRRQSTADTRTRHPAILCVKGVLGGAYNPPKPAYDDIIRTLGDTPDGARLANCLREWCLRGFKQQNLGWVLEWYPDGIPPKNSPRASPRNNGTPRGVVPVDTDPESWLAEAERVRAQRGD